MKADAFEFSSMYPAAAEPNQAKPKSSELQHRPKSAKKNKRTPVESTVPTSDSTPSSGETKSKHNISILKSSTPQSTPNVVKPKKRSKSVSFQADDTVVNIKKSKKSMDSSSRIEATTSESSNQSSKKKNKRPNLESNEPEIVTEKPKNKKKIRKHHSLDINVESSEKITNNESSDGTKKLPEKNMDAEILPQKQKKKKKVSQCEDIEKDLENLEIGVNASKLADLLDNVEIAKKSKKHKKKKHPKNADSEKTGTKECEDAAQTEEAATTLKAKKKKNKKQKSEDKKIEPNETEEEIVKEKVKWNKRKWNKDRRAQEPERLSTVIIDNLPLSLITTYKKVLSEHFSKYGPIKKVGVAEVYPSVEPRLLFTTTLQFQDEAAAKQALEEDNMELCGSRVRVRQPVSPSLSTVVVRCYAGCSPHLLTSVFAPCGRVRAIREILKGKSSMPTAFVEFDGPVGAERALQLGTEVKVGGKKVIVSRFEEKHSSKRKRTDSAQASDNDDES